MAKRKRICVYCGSQEKSTKDHIPPKCLFADLPDDLITVDSCKTCNNGASKDDEYLRDLLIRERRTENHSEARKVRQKFYRALQREESRGYTKSIVDNIVPLDVFTQAGIYIGSAGGYEVDHERLDRVVERIIKGLYSNTHRTRLPDSYEVEVWDDNYLAEFDQDTQDEFLRPFMSMNGQPPTKAIGNGVFAYWYLQAVDSDFVTAWVLRFYNSVFMFCKTVPKD
ncbi:MAG: hypothetical protein OXG98_01975 [Gemmatimonadetes bacterium]|nr:hypothetical protein [Gemmatimonadota bacterium]